MVCFQCGTDLRRGFRGHQRNYCAERKDFYTGDGFSREVAETLFNPAAGFVTAAEWSQMFGGLGAKEVPYEAYVGLHKFGSPSIAYIGKTRRSRRAKERYKLDHGKSD